MAREYVEENTMQRERLCLLVARLSDQDFARPLYGDWTIAAVLAHMAFWDYRAGLLLKRWKQAGVKPSPVDVDILNDAMRPLLQAISPRQGAELALEAANAIDREIEGLSQDLIAQIQANPSVLRLDRARHRREHLDQIESSLALEK